MGMDLIGAGLSYNWSSWYWLRERLDAWGVNTSELSNMNDGDRISGETCRAIAETIELHLKELDVEDRDWIAPHIEIWRRCKGCRQY